MKINKKHYSFKAEVPYFPHFMVDPRDGNEKLISAKMNNDNKTTQISYSFHTKSCKAMHLHTLNNDQRQQRKQTVLAGHKDLMQQAMIKPTKITKKIAQVKPLAAAALKQTLVLLWPATMKQKYTL